MSKNPYRTLAAVLSQVNVIRARQGQSELSTFPRNEPVNGKARSTTCPIAKALYNEGDSVKVGGLIFSTTNAELAIDVALANNATPTRSMGGRFNVVLSAEWRDAIEFFDITAPPSTDQPAIDAEF